MLLIFAFMASMIAAANFGLSVAKNFLLRDWKYRTRVLAAGTVATLVVAGVIIHWLSTPPQ